MTTRYHAPGSQGESEPGSDGAVLVNKLDITSSDEMGELERVLLDKLYTQVLDRNSLVAL